MLQAIPKGAVALTVILALLTAGAVYVYISQVEQTAAHIETVPVIVAKRDIPARTTITPEMLERKQIPKELAVAGGFSVAGNLTGRIAKERILAGEAVREDRLVPEGEKASLPYRIPQGKRAISIAIDEVTGVGNLIRPGDNVDVLVTFSTDVANKDVTLLLLQNIPVLAVGQEQNGKQDAKAEPPKTATLEVTPAEGEKLTLAEERGRLRLMLRPALDETKVPSDGTIYDDILPLPRVTPAVKQ